MTNELPPKTCSIERLITSRPDIDLVLSGKKTVTRRNSRYADPGEIMDLDGNRYEVYNVYAQKLGDISDDDAKAEGFSDFEGYKSYILSMHPGMPWVPQARVWVHEFRPIS